MKQDAALEAISNALFPAAIEHESGWLMHGDAGANLAGVLVDLERMSGDPVCIATIKRVLQQLNEVKTLLREAGFPQAVGSGG